MKSDKAHRRGAKRCGCINAALAGDIATVPGIVCFHERMAIEVADRAASTLYAERNPAFMRTFYQEV